MTIEIRPESPNQFREVEALVREAFWNVYTPGCTEHYLLHVMRRSPNFVCELSLVALEDKAIVGQIAFTRAWIACDDGQNRQVLTLGPLSVHPAHQRKGIGKSLIERACAKACDMGFAAVRRTETDEQGRPYPLVYMELRQEPKHIEDGGR